MVHMSTPVALWQRGHRGSAEVRQTLGLSPGMQGVPSAAEGRCASPLGGFGQCKGSGVGGVEGSPILFPVVLLAVLSPQTQATPAPMPSRALGDGSPFLSTLRHGADTSGTETRENTP